MTTSRHRTAGCWHWFVSIAVLAAFIASLQPPRLYAAPAVSKRVLPNGLTLLIKENPTADLVAVDVLVKAGPRVEEPAEAGISSFVLGAVLRGTERRSAVEIGLALESVGGILRATSSSDYTELATVTPTRHVGTALDVLADLLTNAKFDPVDIETQRRISLSRIRQQADQPLNRALELVGTQLYAFHPYRQPVLGTAETVSALTRDQLLAFYRTFYTAPNMVVTVAGNLRAPAALELVRRAFAGIRTEAVPHRLRLLPAVEQALAPRPSQRQEVREVRQTAGAWIAIGYPAVKVGHRDWAPLRVLSGILGEGLSSRLFVEIREKQGLAYQVGASFSTRAGPGIITLFAGTDPVNLSRVIDGLEREIAALQKSPPSAEELDLAKQRIIGRHAIDHEDLQRQAFLLGWYELLGVGYPFDSTFPHLIAAVTADDVQRVARLYLRHATVAIVLPPAR